MRSIKSSQVPLMFGIVIGLMAVWASAAPILGAGTSVIGGTWYAYWAWDGWAYGCTSIDSQGCGPCNLNGNTSVYCDGAHDGTDPSHPSWECTGGFISIVSPGGVPNESYIYWESWAGCTKIDPDTQYDCTKLSQTTCDE